MLVNISDSNIAGVSVTISETTYTFEAHSLQKVADILGGHAQHRIEAITINYFNAE
jgi:hypothetical protein